MEYVEKKKFSPFQKGVLIAISLLLIGLVIFGLRSCGKDDDQQTKLRAPEFDTVQIEKGKGIIAGRADRDIDVHIVSGDEELGVEKTDARGEFVFLPEKDFTAGTYEISLFVLEDGKKIVSEKKAILTVPADNSDTVAVFISKKETTLAQSPKREKGAGSVGITLVEYDFKEKFNMSGYGIKNHRVRLYLNNSFLGESKIDRKGWWDWKGNKRLIQDKKYKLRADMLDEDGKVVARIEHTFSTDLYEGEPNLYSVKKGDCLWRIAKRELGRGIDYILIFKANKAQIRNPDLIYPNQLFKIPQK